MSAGTCSVHSSILLHTQLWTVSTFILECICRGCGQVYLLEAWPGAVVEYIFLKLGQGLWLSISAISARSWVRGCGQVYLGQGLLLSISA